MNAKLEVAESEIESYKKILSNYQNKISEMKIKCIVDNNVDNNSSCSPSTTNNHSSSPSSSSSTPTANFQNNENDKKTKQQLGLLNTQINTNNR